MLFNSFQFLFFFLIFYAIYLFLNHKWQNRLFLAASCFFYGVWDWRFLFLIFTSIATDYCCAIKIGASKDGKIRKRFWLLSIFVNLSILGFFKYFNFFSANFIGLLNLFGLSIDPRILHIVLPIGISFYTFKTLSYTFDVYAEKMEPTRSFYDYALFVTFFPQLIAGPIMRAKDLLPQIIAPRKFSQDKFYKGCYLIFWGLFQKIFVADNLAIIANSVFSSPLPYNGAKVLLAVYAFTFQIYCDFAGYSNIAIGLGKCLGFDTTINFNLPYFATNPQEFWQRWHITLSNWLHDYIYTPIAFAKREWGRRGVIFAIMVTFFLCGLWHGAAWTFVVWGVYWGLLIVIYMLFQPIVSKLPKPKNKIVAKTWFFIKVALFFHLICLGWLIFRAESLTQAYSMLKSLFFNFQIIPKIGLKEMGLNIFSFLWFLILVQLFQYRKNNLMFILDASPLIRRLFYFVCYFLLLLFGATTPQPFIYFKF
ncbi:MAG: MBOAT family O-acyltransferase [Candidatus Omnitrophota bacterium]|jgi:D-alanyl-lipoteichoic acid acyltransferase DltB (MBOAT superfamily)